MTITSTDAGASRLRTVFPAADPQGYRPHFVHASDRIWSETNCYVDLFVEVLHALGADPVPAFAFTLSSGFDGRQWDFVKFQPEDLRVLYGVDVAEMNIWKPFAEHLAENLSDGVPSTVELDAFYLPDTDGTSYRNDHVKTSVVPGLIDFDAQYMEYFHNSGYYALSGHDFVRALALADRDPAALGPYVERIRIDADVLAAGPAVDDGDLTVIRSHLSRRVLSNPVAALGERVIADIPWVQEAGPEPFHRWSFGTLRQCGATAELAADLAVYLEQRGVAGAGAAEAPLREVASGAKSVQFRMARAARGRAVTLDESLDAMSEAWATGMAVLDSAL